MCEGAGARTVARAEKSLPPPGFVDVCGECGDLRTLQTINKMKAACWITDRNVCVCLCVCQNNSQEMTEESREEVCR